MQRLFPEDGEYRGSIIPFYFLVCVTIATTIRSLIHILAPDGGAHSIAGLAINVAGGTNIITLMGEWGASQLVLSFFYWLTILKYRFLTPFTLFTLVLELSLRFGVVYFKPLDVITTPPGGVMTKFLWPFAVIFFIWSLLPVNNKSGH